MRPYPLLFHPILKPRVWGGRLLESLGKTLPPNEKIGESWEIADLPESVENGRSIIANGDLAGLTLRDAISKYCDLITGDAKLTSEGGFPLLIKFLDAQENLSVQVHPDEHYAAAHPEAHLKSEAWIVVNALPGAVIYKDLKTHVKKDEFVEHVRCGKVIDDLVAVPAQIGDCHYLPSGTCHALGAGVMVAEIQTPSDTTFRVFDWGRTGRELHVEQAMQCIHFGANPPAAKPAEPIEVGGLRTTSLCGTDHFCIERLDAIAPVAFRIVTSGLPEVWMLIAGSGSIHGDHSPVQLAPGTTTLIPADLTGSTISLKRETWILRVKLPSPLAGKIA